VTNFALISRVDKRIDELATGLNRRIDELGGGLNAMQRDHSEVMAKFAEMERRLDRLRTSGALIP